MNKENINKYVKREKELLNKEYEIIKLLSKIRKEKNLSQRALAKLTNIKQPAIVKIEKAEHSPQLNTLLNILDACGYTVEIKKL